MWSPTHVQVTVQRAKDLLIKGKNGTNDAFVTIALGKEKFQTSVKEKCLPDVEWHEECELQIPKQGNTAEIVLTVLHRNFLGVDEFLGVVNISLASFDIYERPRNRWYPLKSKPGKEKKKPRGELEVKIGFIVKAGSLMDLSKNDKHRSSLGQLSQMANSIGGSLLSISSLEKRKGLKKLSKSIGHKVSKIKGKVKEKNEQQESNVLKPSAQVVGDADPGVVTDGESEDDFTFDDLSHKSSGSSLNTSHPPVTPVIASLENLAGGEFLRRSTVSTVDTQKQLATKEKSVDEWEQKLYGKLGRENINPSDTLKRRSWESAKSILSSQPEEEEPDEGLGGPDSLSSSPVLIRTVEKSAISLDKKEDRESKLTKKFKHFRKSKENKMTVAKEIQIHDNTFTQFEEADMNGESTNHIPEVTKKFATKSKEELIELVCEQQLMIDHQRNRLRDLEDYLDNLLLRVMETTPRILQNPYKDFKSHTQKSG